MYCPYNLGQFNCDRLFALAEDKRFAQFAVPESAFTIRSASATAAPMLPSLYRPPDALGRIAHAAERGTRLESCVRYKSNIPYAKDGFTFLLDGFELSKTLVKSFALRQKVKSKACAFGEIVRMRSL